MTQCQWRAGVPKDDWAKARRNDIARRARGGTRGRPRKSRRRFHAAPVPLEEKRIFFGPYAGKTIQQVPVEYIRSYLAKDVAGAPMKKAFKRYLRQLDGPQTQPQPKRQWVDRPKRGDRQLAQWESRQPKVVASQYNPGSKMWFGKYKGTPIQDIPVSYLLWVVRSRDTLAKTKLNQCMWKVDGLIHYLIGYLGL
jgi:uncharacterized protein (DUF3820 family)